jgi:hypothetical protein
MGEKFSKEIEFMKRSRNARNENLNKINEKTQWILSAD